MCFKCVARSHAPALSVQSIPAFVFVYHRFCDAQALLVSPIINLHEGLISLLPSQATANSGPAQDKKPPRVSEQTAYFALAQQPPFPIFERYCNGVQYVINNDEWKRNEPEDTEHPVSNAQAPDNFRPEQSSWAVFGSGPRQCPGRQVALTVLSAASSALLAGDRVIDPADGHNCSGRSNDGAQRLASQRRNLPPLEKTGSDNLWDVLRSAGKNFGLVAQVTVIGQILSRVRCAARACAFGLPFQSFGMYFIVNRALLSSHTGCTVALATSRQTGLDRFAAARVRLTVERARRKRWNYIVRKKSY